MSGRVRRAINNVHWFVDHTDHKKEGRTPRQGRRLVLEAIEAGGNNYLIVFIAGLGFFTDSYILFASNVITPMLGYVYWNQAQNASHENAVNLATLAGCVVGMLAFGALCDRFGRRKVYGWELLLLILGTIGVITSSPGYTPVVLDGDAMQIDWSSYGSMDVVSWLIFWRFVTGIGIGGDYPVGALLVSEIAPTRRRARMLAIMFSMQAVGFAAATIVALIVTVIAEGNSPNPSTVSLQTTARRVDQIWRWVMGLSLIPAFLALVLRLMIPESPRFTLDVTDNISKAFSESNRFNNANLEPEWVRQANIDTIEAVLSHEEGEATEKDRSTTNHDVIDINQSKIQVKRYFIKDGNWRILLGTALCWFFLDIGFYALSLNNPQTVSKLWYPGNAPVQNASVWDTNLSVTSPETGIFTILKTNSTHSLIITSIGALVGSAIMIFSIDKFNRRKFQTIMFLVLAALFIITGATFSTTVQTDFHGVTITLFILCQLAFYCGANSLTFIIPAELFPTKYRGTCHGISSASGKLGSIITVVFLAYVKFDGKGSGVSSSTDPNSKWLGWVLLIFSLPMVLGAVCTWLLIPDIQYKNGKNRSLEELVFVRQRVDHPEEETELSVRTRSSVNSEDGRLGNEQRF